MNKLQIKFTISFIYNADKNDHFEVTVHVHLKKNLPQRSTFDCQKISENGQKVKLCTFQGQERQQFHE